MVKSDVVQLFGHQDFRAYEIGYFMWSLVGILGAISMQLLLLLSETESHTLRFTAQGSHETLNNLSHFTQSNAHTVITNALLYTLL